MATLAYELARNRIWLQIEAEIQFDDSTESKQVWHTGTGMHNCTMGSQLWDKENCKRFSDSKSFIVNEA